MPTVFSSRVCLLTTIAVFLLYGAKAQDRVVPSLPLSPADVELLKPWNNVLVVMIMNDKVNQQQAAAAFASHWGPFFPNIVYYGPWLDVQPLPDGDSYLNDSTTYTINTEVNVRGGQNDYMCVVDAIQRYPGHQGYLSVNGSEQWFFTYDAIPALAQAFEDPERPIPFQSEGLVSCMDSVDPFAPENSRLAGFVRGHADLFFVPGRYSDLFVQLAAWTSKHQLFVEVAVPCIVNCWIPEALASTVEAVADGTPRQERFVDYYRLASSWDQTDAPPYQYFDVMTPCDFDVAQLDRLSRDQIGELVDKWQNVVCTS